jgi:hypothetical protein
MPKRDLYPNGYPAIQPTPEGKKVIGWIVTCDGAQKFSGSSYDDCFNWILRHQGQSVAYALTYGGYAIIKQFGAIQE